MIVFLKNQRGDREKQNKLKDFSSSVLSPSAPSLNVTAKHAHVCMLAFTLTKTLTNKQRTQRFQTK